MAGLNQHLFHTMVCNLLEHNNVVVKANFHIRLQGHSEFVKTTPKVTTIDMLLLTRNYAAANFFTEACC